MKKLIPFLVIALAVVAACQKESSRDAPLLEASHTTAVKKGEPVMFTMATSGAIAWRATPSAGVSINVAGNQAWIRFASAGQYIVTGVSGTDSASTPVTVTDTLYQGDTSTIPGVCTTCPPPDTVAVPPVSHADDTVRFSAGDVLQLQPSIFDSSGATGLSIKATTTENYICEINYLLSSINATGERYELNYPGVFVPYGCQTGAVKASVREPIVFFPIEEGTYPFSVMVNYKRYEGSFIKAGNTYTFTWPHTSSVTISPLVVK